MFAILAIVVHMLVSTPAALLLAPHSLSAGGDQATLWLLSFCSALISSMGFLATAAYLSKPMRLVSGALGGLLCGLACSGLIGLVLRGTDFSLILYLTILVPTLLAVSLASAFDRPRSGWAPLPRRS